MGNASGSLRSASAQGSLRTKGAPNEKMGSVREEDDASFLSFARGDTPVRAASAFSHKRMGSQASSTSRPKTSAELAQGKNRKGEVEGDAGITMPLSTVHDLHVSPELHDLPPAWLQTLKDQGMSAQDLLLIAAARKKQVAARTKGPQGSHSNHGSFSGSISQLSQAGGIQSSSPPGKMQTIKTSRSLPRLSVSGSRGSRTSNGSAETGTARRREGADEETTTAGGHHRRSWLGRKGKDALSPIMSPRGGLSSPTTPSPPSASTSVTYAGTTSPVFHSLLLAHKQQQNGDPHPGGSPSDQANATGKRLSDELRGFANLNLDEEAGWAEGVLGLMQSGTADSTEEGSKVNETTLSLSQGGPAGDGADKKDHTVAPEGRPKDESTPQFQIKVEEADQCEQPTSQAHTDEEGEEPLSREGHTDASYYAAVSMRNRQKAIGLIPKHGIDRTASPSSSSQYHSFSTLSSTTSPRSPYRSAVTPAIAHHKLAPTPSPPLVSQTIPLAADDLPPQRIDSPPIRIASPPPDRPSRSRTSTPDHLANRLRKASSTELLSRYGPNPYAPPRSALPSPPQPGVEIKYSPRPPFRQAIKAAAGTGNGLFNGVGKASSHVRPTTAPKDMHLRRPSTATSADPGSTSDSGMPLRSTGIKHKSGHKHVASMDSAASAEVVTPGGTDEGQTPKPGDGVFLHNDAGPSSMREGTAMRLNGGEDAAALADDRHPIQEDRAATRPTLPNEDSAESSNGGTGLSLGLAARNGSPQRLALRSRRNTQASLPASAADTDELFMPDDEKLPSVPSGGHRSGHNGNIGTPLSTDGEGGGAASPRMSLKTYMFEPDSDDAYSAFGGVDIPDVPDMPMREELLPGLRAGVGMSPSRDRKHAPHTAEGNGTFRLSLIYRTRPDDVPETPPDAPMVGTGSTSPVRKSKKRISLGEIARPLSFSAPYDSMRADKADVRTGGLPSHQGSGISPPLEGDSKVRDMLSPLPTGQDAKDRSRRSSRASHASRISRKSRTSMNSVPATAAAVVTGPHDGSLTFDRGESSNTLLASSIGSDRRKRISALSAFSSRSGMSGFSSLGDSDSDLHDLEDLDEDEHGAVNPAIVGGRRGMGVVREARMTHVGAAPGRASIFALNGLGLGFGVGG